MIGTLAVKRLKHSNEISINILMSYQFHAKKIIWKRNKKHYKNFSSRRKYLIRHNNSTKQSFLQMIIIKIAKKHGNFFGILFFEIFIGSKVNGKHLLKNKATNNKSFETNIKKLKRVILICSKLI